MGLPSAQPERVGGRVGAPHGRAEPGAPGVGPDLRLALARRLDWRVLLPSPELGRVAILGAPDPELEHALASLGPVPSLLDVGPRPAPGDSFDLVVTRETSPRALEHAARLVRPGGWIYVEAGRELGSCSAPTLARRLARAGFVAVRSHWHWPHVARPLEIVPLADPAAVRLTFSRRRSGRPARIKAALGRAGAFLGLLPRFAPAVSAIARRPDGAPPEPAGALAFLEARRSRLDLDALGLRAPLGQLLVTPRFRASSHVVHLILGAGDVEPRLVLKVPRLADGDACLAREAASLAGVASRTRGCAALPRLLAFERWQGRSILVQTALAGRVLDRASVRRSPERWCRAALAWLDGVEDPAAPRLDAAAIARLVDLPLQALGRSLRASEVEQTALAETRAAATILAGLPLRSVIEHGDLSPPNVLRDPQGRLAVLDWELAEMEGLPGCDLFFFLAFVAFARKRARSTPDCVAAFDAAFFGRDAWALPWVRRYAEARRIPTRALTPLFLATWARCVWRIALRLAAVGDGPFSDDTCAWLRGNRYYALWRHALARRGALAWETAGLGGPA